MVVKSTAQAAIDLERITINFSGMSRHQGNSWCPGSDRATRRLAAQDYEETKARDEKISGVLYPLLAAASRRFGGNSAVDWVFCRNLAANRRREAQIQNRTGIQSLSAFLDHHFQKRRASPNTNV
jgi:hypothetical protein